MVFRTDVIPDITVLGRSFVFSQSCMCSIFCQSPKYIKKPGSQLIALIPSQASKFLEFIHLSNYLTV